MYRIIETICLIVLLLIVVSVLGGCVLYRHDIDYMETGLVERDSMTGWTLLKDVNFGIDPNQIHYNSRSKNINVITPYGTASTKD